MPAARPEVLDFLRTRRSRPAKTLSKPAPDRGALMPILEAGLRVPDHGKLEPWRLIVLEGAALGRLAEAAMRLAPSRGVPEDKIAKSSAMFADAPLIVAVISAPVASDKIPAVEQLQSAGAVCLSLVNAALAAGWGANWLTGWTASDPVFHQQALGLEPGESVAGYVVIGSETTPPPERPRPDPEQKIRWVDS